MSQGPNAPPSAQQPAQAAGPSPRLAEAAQGQTQSQIQTTQAQAQRAADMQAAQQGQGIQKAAGGESLYDRAGSAMKDVGQWVEKNPRLSTVMFQTLAGMYGPEAEREKRERSFYERAQRNANSPVRMTYAGAPAGG